MILLTVIEVVRLYLGYIGNLKEKVIQTNILSVEGFFCGPLPE